MHPASRPRKSMAIGGAVVLAALLLSAILLESNRDRHATLAPDSKGSGVAPPEAPKSTTASIASAPFSTPDAGASYRPVAATGPATPGDDGDPWAQLIRSLQHAISKRDKEAARDISVEIARWAVAEDRIGFLHQQAREGEALGGPVRECLYFASGRCKAGEASRRWCRDSFADGGLEGKYRLGALLGLTDSDSGSLVPYEWTYFDAAVPRPLDSSVAEAVRQTLAEPPGPGLKTAQDRLNFVVALVPFVRWGMLDDASRAEFWLQYLAGTPKGWGFLASPLFAAFADTPFEKRALETGLAHSEPMMRTKCLELITRGTAEGMRARLEELWRTDPSPMVRGRALQCLDAFGFADVATLNAAIRGGDGAQKAIAFDGLARAGGIAAADGLRHCLFETEDRALKQYAIKWYLSKSGEPPPLSSEDLWRSCFGSASLKVTQADFRMLDLFAKHRMVDLLPRLEGLARDAGIDAVFRSRVAEVVDTLRASQTPASYGAR